MFGTPCSNSKTNRYLIIVFLHSQEILLVLAGSSGDILSRMMDDYKNYDRGTYNEYR